MGATAAVNGLSAEGKLRELVDWALSQAGNESGAAITKALNKLKHDQALFDDLAVPILERAIAAVVSERLAFQRNLVSRTMVQIGLANGDLRAVRSRSVTNLFALATWGGKHLGACTANELIESGERWQIKAKEDYATMSFRGKFFTAIGREALKRDPSSKKCARQLFKLLEIEKIYKEIGQ